MIRPYLNPRRWSRYRCREWSRRRCWQRCRKWGWRWGRRWCWGNTGHLLPHEWVRCVSPTPQSGEGHCHRRCCIRIICFPKALAGTKHLTIFLEVQQLIFQNTISALQHVSLKLPAEGNPTPSVH
jgi:hypothetical protein